MQHRPVGSDLAEQRHISEPLSRSRYTHEFCHIDCTATLLHPLLLFFGALMILCLHIVKSGTARMDPALCLLMQLSRAFTTHEGTPDSMVLIQAQ